MTRKQGGTLEEDHTAYHRGICDGSINPAAKPEDQSVWFHIESIHHKLSASRNPDRHDRVIMVSGKRAGTEENWIAYLDFNDATQNNPPVIEPDLKTLYIFYPERFFPMVDEILRSPFTTPICLVDLRSHPFGSVEASGPMPFRR